MSIFRFIWWAMIVSVFAFAGYVYGYLKDDEIPQTVKSETP